VRRGAPPRRAHGHQRDPAPTPTPVAEDGIDLYALTHNETSTGVAMDRRPPPTPGPTPGRSWPSTPRRPPAGCAGTPPRSTCTTSPRRSASPPTAGCGWPPARRLPSSASNASRRATAGDPASLDLQIALDNSRKNQTYNTPALATLVLLDAQLEWMLDNGGLEFAAGPQRHVGRDAVRLGRGREWATPFVADPAKRSNVVGTIDLDDAIDADAVNEVLRANGILDTDSYRKLGRNQLRVGMFPAIDPADVEALTRCIDHVVAALT
jgi:phosphoserine aminotransferase